MPSGWFGLDSFHIQVLCRRQMGMQMLCFSHAHVDTLILQVYDVTKFLEEHPGGDEVLLTSTGEDACSFPVPFSNEVMMCLLFR